MRALHFDGSLAVRDVVSPEPREGEAIVRVRRAGICNTDVEIARGYMAFRGVLGHELIGEVVHAPDPAWIGARVAGEINLACGSCETCRRGLGRHCPARTVLGIAGKDGAFAELVTLPVVNLHRIPDAVPDDVAVFVEPLAAAFEILEQLHFDPSSRVAVLGDGKLGLLVSLVLRQTCADVRLVGKHARKRAIAEQAGVRTAGVDDALGPRFDIVVEATGSEAGLDRAIAIVRPRGTIVLKSTFHGRASIDSARIVIDEITIVGSRCGPFEPAIAALASGRIDPRPMIDATFSLEDALRAFQRAQEPGVLKVLIAP